MKITIINGNMRHGSTWHCMDLVVRELTERCGAERTEFFLPKDMPHFCNGCFSCIMNGAQTCPHAKELAPVVRAILEADVLVLTSPVYAMDISGQMKALLDHLCFMWMSHRPEKSMFGKLGLVVSTTAGAGLGHASKTLRNSLKFWGVQRIYTLKTPVGAMRWDDVKAEKRARLEQTAAALAGRIDKAAGSKKLPNPLFRSFFFMMMKGMQKKNTWNPTDRKHWEEQGWLGGIRPF